MQVPWNQAWCARSRGAKIRSTPGTCQNSEKISFDEGVIDVSITHAIKGPHAIATERNARHVYTNGPVVLWFGQFGVIKKLTNE